MVVVAARRADADGDPMGGAARKARRMPPGVAERLTIQ
jgi:hypothetical protein